MLKTKPESTVNNTLSSMVQKDMRNEINEPELKKCNAADAVLVENILLIAQAELDMLQLNEINVEIHGHCIKVSCPLTTKVKISLSCLRNIQNYSPARVHDISIHINNNETILCIEIMDCISRVTSHEIDIVRLAKRKRSFFNF